MFGVDQAKWIAAAKATGPIEQCGDTPISLAAASASTQFLTSLG
jgi:hypothetical protein